ncbi:type II toxin-antitoxin system Phd/YefM family antitoxin [Streptomyces lasiicapitis]|uniref:type II toxin-antitoxin system Phd/YefM family antitoxin n=1 Tax=Streptomyces lasiicapitis TaxID=1923961 RepID=UPI00364D39F2
MAADQDIRIADDGTAEVSMTAARANLTRLIRTVRENGRPAAFTERGERRAYVVTPDFYEQALSNRRKVAALEAALDELPPSERPQELLKLIIRKLEAMDV